MLDIGRLVILFTFIGLVYGALPPPSCVTDSACNPEEKCVYKSNSKPEEYLLCSSYHKFCSCRKVCLHNNKYVVFFYDGCNWCYCADPVADSFACTERGCLPT